MVKVKSFCPQQLVVEYEQHDGNMLVRPCRFWTSLPPRCSRAKLNSREVIHALATLDLAANKSPLS
jgi:hypothetical protein